MSAHCSFKTQTFLGFTTKILSTLFVSFIFATFPNIIVFSFFFGVIFLVISFDE